MSKTILIYSHVPLWVVHHAETVELCLKHLKQGDKVILLSCDGALTSCPANEFHSQALCAKCRKQTEWTLNKILNGEVVDLRLPLFDTEVDNTKFDSIQALEQYNEAGVPLGELVVNQLVSEQRDCYLPLKNYQERIEELLTSARALFRYSCQVIEDNQVDKVYVWNGRRPSDGPVSYASQKNGVDHEVYMSSHKPSHYLTLPATKVHDRDANKKQMRDVFLEATRSISSSEIEAEADIFYNQQRNGKGDYIGYRDFTANFKNEPENKNKKPILTILPSSLWEYFGMGDYRGGVFDNHYDGIEKLLMDERITSRWDCRVRWHPNLATCGLHERARINQIIEGTSQISIHYKPESTIDTYALMDKSDAVLTFGSTAGVEASYYGKPSILAGRALYEDLEACYVPKTYEELILLLDTVPNPKPRCGSIQFGYFMRNRSSTRYSHLERIGGGVFIYKKKQLDVQARMIPHFSRHLRNILSIMGLIGFARKTRSLLGKSMGKLWS